ncbi:MAG: regulatory iron-sulfur-containing complex subunit RicT [Bacteriovorax sp.]|nr:regulatory iron-sulfur-containing complex subunit RicT [Bacteriovorax sp.]
MQLAADIHTSSETVLEEVLEIEIIDNKSELDDKENSNTFNNDTEYVYNSEETEEDQKLQEEKENSRFKEGEKLIMIRVRFPGNARSFPFLVGKRKFAYGQKVVAMSDRGMTVGYINSFPYEVIFNKSMLPVRSIAKVASPEDIQAQVEFRDSEKKAEVICIRLIDRHQLDMILTHVEFTQFGKKAVFYFNAPARVDFRDLVKDLVYDLKMRIELRQISVRDRAAALGSVGACGLQTCCSSFLKNYGNVSIKMAKNQNLALIPTKLNGVCGQIKCCIRYEDDVYTDKRKNLPREGTFIRAINGDKGKVQKLNILIEQFEMLTDNGVRRRYSSNQYKARESDLGSDYRFPEFFDNIINETQAVIGISLEDQIKADKFLEHNLIATHERDLNQSDANFFKKNDQFENFVDEDDNIVAPKHEHKHGPKKEVHHPPRQNPNQNPNQKREQNAGQNNRPQNQNRNRNNPNQNRNKKDSVTPSNSGGGNKPTT